MLLLIDNYDSFTYNLLQYLQGLQQEVMVVKNDQISLADIETLAPAHLVISPGPKTPADAGISMAVIDHFHQRIPILGVCLGHQCLAAVFGGTIVRAPEVRHGKTSLIHHQQQGLFYDLPSPFSVMRYHSLAVDIASLPDCFSVDAWTKDTIMAISHRQYPLFGLQFHPESILSEHGMTLLNHFINCRTKSIS